MNSMIRSVALATCCFVCQSGFAESQVVKDLRRALEANDTNLEAIAKLELASQKLTPNEVKATGKLLWEFAASAAKAQRLVEFEENLVEQGKFQMKYLVKKYGKEPAQGHALLISMHGGGGAPARVNDQQWRNQIRLYDLEEAIVVAPRAPTNTWNLWHQAHIDDLLKRIVENFILFEKIDPERVFLTGYSAGGDGVYQLAPRIPQRFAAAAMMAGHPNETQADGLRNLPYALHVGENDSAYNRNKIAATWKETLAKLNAEDPQGYQHSVVIEKGMGHWMQGKDIAGIRWMMKFKRNVSPDRIVWLQDDVTHTHRYWLNIDDEQKEPRKKIIARKVGNIFNIEQSDYKAVTFALTADDCDLSQPVEIQFKGQTIKRVEPRPSIATQVHSLQKRLDPLRITACEINVELPTN